MYEVVLQIVSSQISSACNLYMCALEQRFPTGVRRPQIEGYTLGYRRAVQFIKYNINKLDVFRSFFALLCLLYCSFLTTKTYL